MAVIRQFSTVDSTSLGSCQAAFRLSFCHHYYEAERIFSLFFHGYGVLLPITFVIVYDRNHLFGLGSDTETENCPKLSADTETNRSHKILNC